MSARPAAAPKTAVRLRFCRESNDLLYPREDKLRKARLRERRAPPR
jgi:hypothetical protein